jgi:hypothetical protein
LPGHSITNPPALNVTVMFVGNLAAALAGGALPGWLLHR